MTDTSSLRAFIEARLANMAEIIRNIVRGIGTGFDRIWYR